MKNADAFDQSNDIAIVGMACRLPGARNIDEFWHNLREGVEAVSFFSDEELLASGIDPTVITARNYVKAGAVLEDIEMFDAAFFSLTPREAEIMDPQHRIFLECAWHALEHAGYTPESYRGRIGIYAGVGMNTYLSLARYNADSAADLFQMAIGNEKEHLATHTAYKLNLKGPSISVSTACSTSLVAVHMACQSLLNSECDMFLAGGVSVRVVQKAGYLYQVEGIASPDGHCRAFDAKALGTVPGNGAGVVVLKRLDDALRDGDCIHAVIKGSATNNDGSLKVGYTAPGLQGQAAVIAEAQAVAGIEPEEITYIETHGTGTPLGDSIEMAALTKVFRDRTQKKGFCAIGSVKTNVGHLDTASGVTGLIKTALALKHRVIPPSLHFEQPNPQIDFASSPFYVNTSLTEWKAGNTPRRAGVSSFGLGGTNVHVILEEAPEQKQRMESRPWQLLCLSARTDSALDALMYNLAEHLEQNVALNLSDVAHTLLVGRKTFSYRQAVVCRDINDAVQVLKTADPARTLRAFTEASDRSVVFLFPGVGDQYVRVAWGLYQTVPRFRQHIDQCAELLKRHLQLDLRDVLYPDTWRDPEKLLKLDKDSAPSEINILKMLRMAEEPVDAATQLLNETRIAQPAVFVIEYALARLWMEWIGNPGAMVGYSLGEYVVACLAGVLSLEDALFIVARRAQWIDALPAGAMLAVPLPESEVRKLLGAHLSMAAVNTSSLCVVSGPVHAIRKLEQELAQKDIDCRKLQTSHAFHSKMMAPIVDSFVELFKAIKMSPPTIPYLSNVTGTWITPEQAIDPHYWARHMCQEIRFADSMRELFAHANHVLLEVGPGQTLSSLALQNSEAASSSTPMTLPSLRYTFDHQPDMAFLLNTLGRLWLAGIAVNWSQFYAREQQLHVPLPTYPFERQRYWIKPQEHTTNLPPAQKSQAKRPNVADWFYLPSWKYARLLSAQARSAPQKQRWLVFVDAWGLGAQIVRRLEEEGQDVATVVVGAAFARLADKKYALHPHDQSGYDALLKDLYTTKRIPNVVVHCWSMTATQPRVHPSIEVFNDAQHTGFYSLIFLAQSLGKYNVTDPLHIRVMSDHLHVLERGDFIDPVKATLFSPCKVIPQEYTNISCQCIDIALPETGSQEECELLDQLMEELYTPMRDQVIVYRGIHRWVQIFEAHPLENSGQPLCLREKGVYLITGGLGMIGFYLARWLAKSVQARLILTGRTELPAREEWSHWVATHEKQDGVSRRIRKVQELEELGAEVVVMSADVAHEAQMQAVVAHTLAHFGALHGVIYAAGVASEKNLFSMQGLDYSACELHFQPKVYGSLVLEKVLQNCAVDFCLLFSSLSSVLGGLQFTPYAAANMFLDAYAHYHNLMQRAPWISVDWDGVATPAETVDAIGRILSVKAPERIVVSTGDLYARLDQWIALKPLQEEEQEKKSALELSSYHPKPHLQNAYIAPTNELEQSIVEIWQAMIGIEPIGIHDNFFMLGGHSLLATRIVTRLRKVLQVELPLRTFLETPTIAELAVAVTQMRTEQTLGNQLDEQIPPLVPISRAQDLQLSFAQQRLWFLDQLTPGNAAYNIPVVIQLKGVLVSQALERSLEQTIQRHEILRTTFQVKNGQPVQVIGLGNSVRIPLIDLSELRDVPREAEVRRLQMQQAQQSFALESGPLLRPFLLRLNQQEHMLFLLIHHIITDGWSNDILFHELGHFYNAILAGQLSLMPALLIQYADFAVWQRQWLQGKTLQTQLDYWMKQLAGIVPLELPTDHPRPPVQTFHGAHQFVFLPLALSNELQELSQRENVTLFMLLFGAFQVLLARYSGQTDLCVGTSIANRTQSEVERLIGFFVNTLVMRVDLSGNPTFRQVLARVQEVCLGAYAHQDVPFEQLVEVVQPERDLSRSPLFQVQFELQNTPRSVETWQGLTLGVVLSESAMTKFDLTLSITETKQGLHCEVEYNTDLFEASTIQRWLRHWQVLLESLAMNPHCRINDLTILTAGERQQLLLEWNTTSVEREPDQTLPILFEQQVQRCSDRVALAFEDEYLTYNALNSRANQLAHWLRILGIGPEIIVGVALERSLLLSISLLGILKAGGAYLPFDPAYPEERLAYMVEDARIPALLTTTSLRLRMSNLYAHVSSYDHTQHTGAHARQGADEHPCRIVCLDTAWNDASPEERSGEEMQAINLQSIDNPVSLTSHDNLAYVIYTSGSTGMPKGAMVTHEGMLNHLWAKVETLDLQEADVVAQTASQCFDISVWQLLAELLRGGRVQIVADTIAHDPHYLLHTIELYSVTILQMVPSLLGLFLDELALHPPAFQWKMRWLVVTGEAMPLPLCRRWWRERAEVRLLNAYGPTECSDDVSHALLEAQGMDEYSWRVPIGRPIANTQLYLLNERLEPVPLGVVGEIYVGGRGVGRGYLGQVERTATAFVPDPYSPKPGRRLYQTGDRGRYREDGQIEFVERQDEQVKLRGYRIELGEIAEVLRVYSAIREAVVVMNESRPGEKHLVAYLVSNKPEKEVSTGALRSYIQDKLPAYMVPSFFVFLDALPLTANGKIDRQALPDPEVQEDQPGETVLHERRPIEEVVTEVWCEVLGLGRAGIRDNFFAQGGHSLLATKLIARLRSLAGVELPLRSVFEAPTIEGLAHRVEQALSGDKQRKVSTIIARERPEMVPLSFAQQRLWFLDQLEPENPAYNITGGVRLRGKLMVQALERCLAEIVQRHESLRTTFQNQRNQAVQAIHSKNDFRLLQADLGGPSFAEREHEVQRLAREEGERPFNLTHGPLLRVLLLRLSTEEHILLVTMHHIISDGWSLNVLVQELTTLYFAFVTGQPSPLTPLPIQYADFALWQREQLQGERLDNLISYWEKQLKGATSLKLPVDRPEAAVTGNRGAVHSFTLSAQLSRDLIALSRQEGVTLFMILLTAFQILLYRYTGQQDIVVGTDIANRTHAETEGIIGFFVNLLPLRSRLHDQDTFRDALRNVCAMVLNAYAHQDLPFDQLINLLQLERMAHQTPLVNVLFVLQNIPPLTPEFQGLIVDLLDTEIHRAKFDLAMFLMEKEQQITGYVNYRTDLFAANTVSRLCTQLEILLQSVIASPDTALADLEMYPEKEKMQRLRKELEVQEARRNRLKIAKNRAKSLPGER